MTAIIDYQQAYEGEEAILADIPTSSELERWANVVLAYEGVGEHEVTVRFTDEVESQALKAHKRTFISIRSSARYRD